MNNRSKHGMVLFGHGARNASWAEPLERLATKLRTTYGISGPVSLAFLELMAPSLPTAIAQHVSAGCAIVTVIPIFFGQGEHIQRTLPKLLTQCRSCHLDVEIRCAPAAGEDDAVLNALAQYCVRQLAP